jgi:septal ring factor EnvC (AmiA/AmiB activator)
MQLEKATSPGGEAGLAGWISSNDVTLFTVVLVVVVAIFLQANVIKGSKQNLQLEDDKATLATQLTDKDKELEDATQRLKDTDLELRETTEQLAKTEQDLAVTKKERDDLENTRKELDEKLKQTRAEVLELSRTLDALNLEKKNLLVARDELTEEKKDLTEIKVQLDEDLADLTVKLKERLSQLDDMKKERDLLDDKAKALNDRVARLEQQLGDSADSMEELKKSSESEMESLKKLLARALERHKADQAVSARELQDTRARAQEADAKAKEATERAEDYLSRLQRAADYVEGINENKQMLQFRVDALKVQLANALDDLKESQQQLSQSLSREKSINRELVGLRGGLRRVAILFDSSGSMGQDGRWEEVQRIASTWLDHLNVDECVLIVFSDEATAFPVDGSMLRVSGPDGDANRIRLLNQLRSVKPSGWTNTLAAMQKAYGYADLDTIILFSDGAPTYDGKNVFNAEAAQQIYALCRRHSNIPVNAIGLGNYFDEELSTFLRTVAHLTGGTFLGR